MATYDPKRSITLEPAPLEIRWCSHGVRHPDDPAVMPDCDGCMEAQEEFWRNMEAAVRTAVFSKPKLPPWMRH
jgi:hypothetical protein